jgi:hypothetical protein
LRCGAIAVDAKNQPHILYSSAMEGTNCVYLASLIKASPWRIRKLAEIQEAYPGYQSTMPGGLCISDDGTMHAVAQICKTDASEAEKMWGHPSTEIVRLTSRDSGQSIAISLDSEPNPDLPNWLPNIERPTGFNHVVNPSLIYTAGIAGKKNTDVLSNDVVWVK